MTQIQVLDNVGDAGEAAIEAVIGGGAYAVDAVRRPGTTVRRAQRRGQRATTEVSKQVNRTVEATVTLPERVLHSYLRAVKAQARRRDVIGVAARTVLGAVNGPSKDAAAFFGRIERVTELPKGAPRTKATPRRAVSATQRVAKRAVAKTTVRRGTGRAATPRTTRGTGRATTAGANRGTATRRPARRSA